jgi:hypothetical protein
VGGKLSIRKREKKRDSVSLYEIVGSTFTDALNMILDGFYQMRLNFNLVLLATSLKITRRSHLVVTSVFFLRQSAVKNTDPRLKILCF